MNINQIKRFCAEEHREAAGRAQVILNLLVRHYPSVTSDELFAAAGRKLKRMTRKDVIHALAGDADLLVLGATTLLESAVNRGKKFQ